MSVLTAKTLITVEEARILASHDPANRYELHDGKMVKATVPKLNHVLLERHITKVLEPLTSSYGLMFVEFGFRAVPDFDIRRADIALISYERMSSALDDVFGAPDLVIEVQPSSNRKGEISAMTDLRLDSGCLSFWVINSTRRTIEITGSAGNVVCYGPTDDISPQPFGMNLVSVHDLIPVSRPIR